MSEESALSLPPPPRVGRLASISDVRRELCRVYKDARTGRIETQEGARLTYMLATLAKIIEGSDLADRIEKLERAAAAKGEPYAHPR